MQTANSREANLTPTILKRDVCTKRALSTRCGEGNLRLGLGASRYVFSIFPDGVRFQQVSEF